MELNMDMKQSQVISAQQIQSMAVLQMSSQELLEYINEAVVENPVLDVKDNFEEKENQDLMRKLQWLESQDKKEYYIRYDDEENKFDSVSQIPFSPDEETLFNHLKMQLEQMKISKALYHATCFVASNLSPNGYQEESLKSLSESFGCDELLMQQAWDLIRTLEPSGVGAVDLADCLSLQLSRLEGTELANKIVIKYLDKLSKNQYAFIAKELKVSESQVRDASEIIRSLDPKPGSAYDSGSDAIYVRPDIIILKFQDHFELLNVDYELPKLQINQYYNKLFKESDDRELTNYLGEKIKKAKWLINSITQRNTTLLKCARAILNAQEAFFRGNTNNLYSLTMAELAQQIGINESTVSRALKGKYLQCAQGVFPMNYFLPRRIRQGEDMSTDQAKEALMEIIESENKKNPLSDMKIVQKMQERDIQISRRTVAKYRGELFIPNASGRKNI